MCLLLCLIAWFVLSRGGPSTGEAPVADATDVATAEDAVSTERAAESPADPSNLGGLESFDVDGLMAINMPAFKLQQIANAFFRHSSAYRELAKPRLQDQQDVPEDQKSRYTQLSWRVHLLPYLEQVPLYEKFRLDEPWDSPHNMTLLDKMPDIYRVDLAEESTTRFRVITGPNALFGNPKPPRFRDIVDGKGNTILALISGVDRTVPWTQPDDFELDAADPIASLGRLPEGCVLCVTADGQALPVSTKIAAAEFMALTTPRGNEVVDGETMRRAFQENFRVLLAKKMKEEGKGTTRDVTKVSAPVAAQGRSNRLKRISGALYDFHAAYKQFPVSELNPDALDAEGKPHLSWRVHLLPMLGHSPLYDSFHLDEPWDSPHNRSLIEKMPDVYRDPYDQLGDTKTRYVRLTGPETAFPQPHGSKLRSIRGTSDTLLLVSAGPDTAVVWTKPEDIAFDLQAPVACLGDLSDTDSIFYVRGDGGVSSLSPNIPPEMFKALVSPAGERLPKEFANFKLQ